MDDQHFVPNFELEADAHGETLASSSIYNSHDNTSYLHDYEDDHDDDDDDSLMARLLWQKEPVSLPLREVGDLPMPSYASAATGDYLFMEENEMIKWIHGQFYQSEENPSQADFGSEPPGPSSRNNDAAVSVAMVEGAGKEPESGLARDPEGRKQIERGAIEHHCEEEEFECGDKRIEDCQPASRKTRSAKIHNLSERRRRDRINEKIKALQDLIPRCNKSDKASILDDAIEYLKSLQLQVKMMSIEYNTRHMMFSNTQSYMPLMGFTGIGMGTGMPSGSEICAGTMQHSFMPLGSVLGYPPLAGSSPSHLKLPLMPSLHSVNFAIADQLRGQTYNNRDPASSSVNMLRPNLMQMSDFVDPHHIFAGLNHCEIPSQIQARTDVGNSKKIDQ